MRSAWIAICIAVASVGNVIYAPASAAKTCDDIKDKKKRANCKAGQEMGRAYQEEADAWNKAARLRDQICIADKYGPKIIGWKGKIVYRGTREAADWISKGASSCPTNQ